MVQFIKDYVKMYTRLFAFMYIVAFIALCGLLDVRLSTDGLIHLIVIFGISILSKLLEWIYMSSRAVIKYRKLPKDEESIVELNLMLREFISYVVTLAIVRVTKLNYLLWILEAPLCIVLVFIDCIMGIWTNDYIGFFNIMYRPWYVCQSDSSPFSKSLKLAGLVYGKCPKLVSDTLIDDVYNNRDLSKRLSKEMYNRYPLVKEGSDEQ